MDARSRLPLNALRSFRSVVEHASFSRAAIALNVTQAAVSSSIKSLEQYLGVKLFERSGRDVKLSPQGEILFHNTVTAMDEIQTTLRIMRGPVADQVLRITMLPSLATHWFLPRLPAFVALEPKLQIQLILDRRLVDFQTRDVHAAIRFGPGKWKGLRTQYLFDDWLIPVCTPQFLETQGPISSLPDLLALALLETSSEPWDHWVAAQPVRVKRPRPHLVTDDSGVLLDAAQSGIGVALARWSLAYDRLESGVLVPALKIATAEPFSYWLAWPPELDSDVRLDSFRKWVLLQAASMTPPPFASRRRQATR